MAFILILLLQQITAILVKEEDVLLVIWLDVFLAILEIISQLLLALVAIFLSVTVISVNNLVVSNVITDFSLVHLVLVFHVSQILQDVYLALIALHVVTAQ
jgi:hypothetical protein